MAYLLEGTLDLFVSSSISRMKYICYIAYYLADNIRMIIFKQVVKNYNVFHIKLKTHRRHVAIIKK